MRCAHCARLKSICTKKVVFALLLGPGPCQKYVELSNLQSSFAVDHIYRVTRAFKNGGTKVGNEIPISSTTCEITLQRRYCVGNIFPAVGK